MALLNSHDPCQGSFPRLASSKSSPAGSGATIATEEERESEMFPEMSLAKA